MNIKQPYIRKIGALLLVVVTLISTNWGQGAPVQAAPLAATVTVELWAKPGTLLLPGGVTVPIWGYTDSATGAAQVPGPAIIVNEGDTVQVTLHNDLLETSALFFGGQTLPPDLVGAAASGGTASYTFVATNPGTYLYEAGPLPNAQHQTAMGLFGALIVRPLTAGQAYNSAATVYDDEALVVLSEIDPNLNNSATPATFDLRNYSPRYWLINGKAHPDTVAITSDAGHKVLLRYVNAGLQYHSMTVLGLNQTVVAKDGSLLPYPNSLAADTLAPGQTVDTITTIPATTAPDSRFALYDGNFLNLRNTDTAGFGGLVTFITTGVSGPAPDTTGPTTSGLAVTAGVLSGSVSDAVTGNANVTVIEYYVDSTSSTPFPISIVPAITVSINEPIPSGLLTSNHIFYVRGQDALGNWGPFSSVTYTAPDIVGPTTSALVLAPNPNNGTADVTLSATATDSTSNVTAAEYTIDGGAPVAMNVNAPALIANLTAIIPAATVNALAQGPHVIAVRSQDAAGNWGATAQINLLVDKTGPVASGVIAAPNPNNGALGISPSQAVVRVTATLVDTPVGVVAAANRDASTVVLDESTIATLIFMPVVMANGQQVGVEAAAVPPGTTYVQKAEGFIDTVGANGTGFPLTPSDGLYDEATEDAYVYIPLSTINQLSSGNHTIHIRGQDGAGNWGSTGTTILVIDKAAPTFTSITLAPNSFAAGSIANVTLTVNGANDGTGSGVAGGEYWFGTTDPAPGGGTAFTGLSTSIPVGSLAIGTYTVRTRIRDAANNWSTGTNGIRSATLTVTPPPPPPFYFSTSGNTNPPGVSGPADDADIYFWNGTAFSRVWDASTNGVPGGANVDGLVRLSATQHYLSFNGDTNISGFGIVQDEDIVAFNAGVWSVQFNGTGFGLTAGNLDIDAFDYVGTTLYLSTSGNTNPPGAGGGADDADIYRWNGGSSYTRIFDASTAGLPGGANVDGLTMVDPTHFYLSFTGDVTVTGLGAVQDEDVVYYNAGVWSFRVDGTALGLTNGNLDLDAIDVP